MRKKTILLIALPILVFCLILIFFINGKLRKNNTIQETHLPALYTEGNMIKRSDTNENVQLKGVTSMIFKWNLDLDDRYKSVLEYINTWNINLLGLFISPNVIDNRLKDLDFIITWAEKNKIYVYLMPVQNDNENFMEQAIHFPQLMGKLADRYRYRNNVIYGLCAEPIILWDNWYPLANGIIAEIKKANPDAVILFNGAEYGRVFYFSKRIPYSNIILDFHDYRGADIDALKMVLADDLTFDFVRYSGLYPILVGEFGGVWESGFGQPEDLFFTQKVLDEVNRNGLNYSAFTLDNHPDVSRNFTGMSGLRLVDWETLSPTKKGQLIKDDLQNYPPTDFD